MTTFTFKFFRMKAIIALQKKNEKIIIIYIAIKRIKELELTFLYKIFLLKRKKKFNFHTNSLYR